MKIFISADMEGISGVATNMQLSKDSEYQRFRKLMTQDVNAAIAGAFDGGATDVVVADGHGNMSNILIEDLDERATLISGNNRVMCQLEGLDDSYSGVFFVGHHGREGGDERAVINHTLAGVCVSELRVNGQVVGETQLNARVAGQFGVPALFVAGDDAYVREVQQDLPHVVGAVVKRGIDRYAAELLPPRKAQQVIRAQAAEAMKLVGHVPPLVVTGPVTFEVEYKTTAQAHMTTTIPLVEQVGPKTIRFTSPDMVTAYKLFWGCVIIGMTATTGVLGAVNA
ncbi:M55 family metallopeptidase [Alicyclobacillus sp. ALC3]|uniref:M55 family metallopeptidase n=1 Tax=Alicyclobacillus sp. ALC3 TaxID=2796143 RepID=UPI002377E021|nr:M55 family metallopeptidase [Alicyclobacillus sp. ALC3]WDL96241.1 M55 family metallopeptidase [Alicyclobacillus sp. ALC3]